MKAAGRNIMPTDGELAAFGDGDKDDCLLNFRVTNIEAEKDEGSEGLPPPKKALSPLPLRLGEGLGLEIACSS